MDLETTTRPERTERAGIPTYWADVPGPFTAALAFRAGIADEVLANHGITHLLEHVVLSTVGRREHPWNGRVDSSTCLFWAEGERDEVLEFLRLVGSALVALPWDRVDLERRVLRAEAGREEPSVVARMLDHRFGAAGVGLSNYSELGLRWLQAWDLRDWAAERFTRGNAVLWMTGEPPDDLGVELPEGPRRPVPAPEPLDLQFPGYVAEGSGGVALTGLGERSTALRVAMAVAGERLYDAVRRDRGLAYAPAGGYMELDRDLGHAFLGADCGDEHAGVVLQTLSSTVLDLAEHGATEEELERHRRQAQRARNDPDRLRRRLDYEALGELTGGPVLSDEEAEREFEALDAAAVAAAMERVQRTALVLGPAGCPPPDPAMVYPSPRVPEPVTGGETFAMPGRKRRLRRREGGARLNVDERGVTFEAEGQEPLTILWDRCEAAVRTPSGALVLHQRDGSRLEVRALGWDHDPVGRVEELLPPGRIVPACDRELAEAIDRVARRRIGPGDGIDAVFVDELPAVIASGEQLIDFALAYRPSTLGLLVVTDRRVVWLTLDEDKGFTLTAEELANADATGNQLEIYTRIELVRMTIQPAAAAESLAVAIRELRTQPVP